MKSTLGEIAQSWMKLAVQPERGLEHARRAGFDPARLILPTAGLCCGMGWAWIACAIVGLRWWQAAFPIIGFMAGSLFISEGDR